MTLLLVTLGIDSRLFHLLKMGKLLSGRHSPSAGQFLDLLAFNRKTTADYHNIPPIAIAYPQRLHVVMLK